ncbi:CDP-alcohol phosphatidyltransferase family protein [Candidatus Methylobacter oryzae]|uniref:CDP-alcohol phosphatidyltransferase family protein n=1 Tax=Candidatus Methylobacter oryzae TaxID=2497749 RepID=A0ABY3C8V9_9GAMM|nr:CDP-alcohol phosphatidyltransferase family protein [Candidatus Methylobacter oryzae]TRW92699.1 CDP-alcohol phosphatidyltransferase family protein [Candidatus Methylobacter oryzae]
MASIYDIKPAFQNLLRPSVRWLAARGVTANQVTLAAMALSLLVGAALLYPSWYPGIYWSIPLVMLVRMALNAIDGMLAREHNMQSALGGILNELCDVFADTALYLPFALLPGAKPWLVVGIVIAAVISEMAGVVAVQIGASRRYDGPMGKSDRAFVFGALALCVGLGWHGAWVNALFAVILLLIGVTIVNRCLKALREVNA